MAEFTRIEDLLDGLEQLGRPYAIAVEIAASGARGVPGEQGSLVAYLENGSGMRVSLVHNNQFSQDKMFLTQCWSDIPESYAAEGTMICGPNIDIGPHVRGFIDAFDKGSYPGLLDLTAERLRNNHPKSRPGCG